MIQRFYKEAQKILDKILSFLPHLILVGVIGSVFIFFMQVRPNYEQFIGILSVVIWPSIVLCALLFFKKVFVYLFFSMEEYNFFGVRGQLKDVREVIDEKVEERILQEKEQENSKAEINRFKEELDRANSSKDGEAKKAQENLELANEIFGRFKELSEKYSDLTNELNEFRRQKAEREARMVAMRQRIKMRKNDKCTEVDGEISNSTLKASKPIDLQNN